MNDGDTGLYFYNARYYDPALHRFIQADTIVPDPNDPQTLNRFSYVNNNPIRYTDPTGHQSECSDADSLTCQWSLEQWQAIGLILKGNFSEYQLGLILESLNFVLQALGPTFSKNLFYEGITFQYDPIGMTNDSSAAQVESKTFIRFNNSMQRYSTIHELGHIVDNMLGRCGQSYSSGGCGGKSSGAYDGVGGWDVRQYRGEIYWHHTGDLEGASTKYSVINPVTGLPQAGPGEDFAEVFTYKVLNAQPNPPSTRYQLPDPDRMQVLDTAISQVRSYRKPQR